MKKLAVACCWCKAIQQIDDHRSNCIFYRCFYCKRHNTFDKFLKASEKLELSSILVDELYK